jgi:hypothetical protein
LHHEHGGQEHPLPGCRTEASFAFIEIMPEPGLLAGWLAEYLGKDITNVDEQNLTSLIEDDDDLIAALVKEYKASSDTATH